MDDFVISNSMASYEEDKVYASIDFLKLVMAFLVIGIHTEPFGFSVWLDRGFGIFTRLCVPFFFCTSAYFYWLKDKGAMHFLKRILLLYIVWSVIYLPFEFSRLSYMGLGQILYSYLWVGDQHALWYLSASAIGFILTYLLLKIFKPKAVFLLSVAVLLIGCFISTWSPLLENFFGIQVICSSGGRNGLFYAFPYTALGMFLAKHKNSAEDKSLSKLLVGFAISFIALCVESVIFALLFNTSSSILWFSALPCTYFFFMFGRCSKIQMDGTRALLIRKISTLIYVSQYLFIPIWSKYCCTMNLFLLTSASALAFSLVIIKLSTIKHFRWTSILY